MVRLAGETGRQTCNEAGWCGGQVRPACKHVRRQAGEADRRDGQSGIKAGSDFGKQRCCQTVMGQVMLPAFAYACRCEGCGL